MLGWFRCWSCGHSVHWNKLAERLGLRAITGEDAIKKEADDYVEPETIKAELIDEGEVEDLEKFPEVRHQLVFYEKFPFDIWRGFTTKFIEKLGARYAWSHSMRAYIIWFPVMIFGELEGYVRSRIEIIEGKASHLNAPGRWSAEFGLLFFDFAVKMMTKQGHKTIVLVEGPRDALRLLRDGVPAIAILGSQNFSEDKRFLLERAGIENIIIFMDGDDAGKKANELVYESVRMHFNTKFLALWKVEGEYDPGNCPDKYVNKIRRQLEAFKAVQEADLN